MKITSEVVDKNRIVAEFLNFSFLRTFVPLLSSELDRDGEDDKDVELQLIFESAYLAGVTHSSLSSLSSLLYCISSSYGKEVSYHRSWLYVCQ